LDLARHSGVEIDNPKNMLSPITVQSTFTKEALLGCSFSYQTSLGRLLGKHSQAPAANCVALVAVSSRGDSQRQLIDQ